MIEIDFYVIECPGCKCKHLKCDVTKDGMLMFQMIIEPRFIKDSLGEKCSMFSCVLIDLGKLVEDELPKAEQEQ